MEAGDPAGNDQFPGNPEFACASNPSHSGPVLHVGNLFDHPYQCVTRVRIRKP